MARARIPNVNFTISLEEQVRAAAQGLPAFIKRSRWLEFLMQELELQLTDFHRREMEPVARGLKAVTLILREGSRGRPRRRQLKGALKDLSSRVRRYNRNRERFLRSLDLSPLNGKIEDFHRYYVIEREAFCHTTVRPEVLSRWRPLESRDLEQRLPPLPEP
jgi:hypothetical protein